MLYLRALLLRNCGRFTHVSSDFGSQYHTHIFVTSEALYASLTREVTWRHSGRFVDLEEDAKKSTSEDYFFCDYDVSQKPVWFIPGLFVDRQLRPLPKQRGVVDKNDFNVVNEGYPGTGGGGRAHYVPTYGRIESILPNHLMLTCAISPSYTELEGFIIGQTFMLAKKRTMMQMVELSEIVAGQLVEGTCTTPYLQIPIELVNQFSQYEILAATYRYLLVRGRLRTSVSYWAFSGLSVGGVEQTVSVPEFYVKSKLPV
ncbi:MAG: hypothetical protein AB1374_11590 [Bacillota bacterium]